jgi:hypothetical protein
VKEIFSQRWSVSAEGLMDVCWKDVFLCENAGGHDCAALLLFRRDALLGIYQITLAYPRL